MADGCELRVHPTGKAVVRLSVQTQGQGHETTFAQIVAEELGIPPGRHRRRARRHRPDAVRPGHLRQPVDARCRVPPPPWSPARSATRREIIASGMLEASVADLEWEKGSFHVKGDPVSVGDHPGHRDARARRGRPAGGHRGRPRRPDLLQPGEPHLPVRRVLLRGRHRSRAPPW